MRRSATITISRDGRDKGDTYVLTEMPAIPTTEWCIRAMQLLVRSGADVPPNIMSLGAAGFITIGIGTVLTGLGKAPWHEVKPLLDELLTCVTSLQKAGGDGSLTQWGLIRTQIEEPTTILQLYEEVVSLHLGFSLRARLSTYRTLVANLLNASGQNTETLTPSSPGSSPADSPV